MVLTVRAVITTYLAINAVVNPTLLFGIWKRRTVLFFPYFFVATAIIPVGIIGGIYLLTLSGQISLALVGLMWCSVEILFLYAVLSLYKMYKDQSEGEISKGIY